MPLAIAIVISAFCFSLVSPISLSQSCEPTDEVRELFEYSKIAERLEDRENNESCLTGGIPLAYGAGANPLAVPDPLANPESDEDFEAQLRGAVNRRAFVERSSDPDINHVIYVGCEDETLWFDAAIEMRFYRQDQSPDTIHFNAVYRERNSINQWSSFIDHNLIDPNSSETLVFPGAEQELRQWIASTSGENCVLPAARFAVYAICEHAENGGAPDSSFRMEGSMPIVVGHSLGGAAAQFIATSRQPEEGVIWPTCPGVHAYAFGSIGLEDSSDGEVRGTLKSYASSCDWVASFFPERVQTGELFTLLSVKSLDRRYTTRPLRVSTRRRESSA